MLQVSEVFLSKTLTSTLAKASEQKEDDRKFLFHAKCSGTLSKSEFCVQQPTHSSRCEKSQTALLSPVSFFLPFSYSESFRNGRV